MTQKQRIMRAEEIGRARAKERLNGYNKPSAEEMAIMEAELKALTLAAIKAGRTEERAIIKRMEIHNAAYDAEQIEADSILRARLQR